MKTREQKIYDALQLLHETYKIIAEHRKVDYLGSKVGEEVVRVLKECDPYENVKQHIFY